MEGRHGAIGIIYEIYDTYKAKSLGDALFMLYSDYDIVLHLTAWDTTKERGMFDVYASNKINESVVKATPLIPFDYPRRETSPRTGTYRYYRDDAPDNYKW